MALTMYQLSIPALVRGLGVLTRLLDKAEAHARDNGISPTISSMPGWRRTC